jgi:flotillin
MQGPEAALAMMVVGGAVGVLILLALVATILPQFLNICLPNEILIFSGRKHKLPDGNVVGFKVIHGGRGFRVPLLETVSRMDMRLQPVELTVQNAYSKGGIPLHVQAIANVKIASDPALVRNAVERFLGAGPQQVADVSRQTLEGVLREVLSQLTPEEVNEDRLKFAETLMTHARDDFEKLGLELDVLKVQHVSDEQQYLANLGRARVAAMIRDAQNAENQANQVISEQQAIARQRAESTLKQSEALILQKRNELRAELAKLESEAKSVEVESGLAAETARMTAEQELQQARAELAIVRLQSDTVLPAEAKRMAEEAKARGSAAPIVENGKASAEALRLVADEWKAAGTVGRELYVLNQLRTLTEAALARVARTDIGEAVVIDAGQGDALAALVASHPRAVAEVMRESAAAIGIDIQTLLRGPAAGGGR